MHYLIAGTPLKRLDSVLLNYYLAMPGSSDLRATKTAPKKTNMYSVNQPEHMRTPSSDISYC